MKWNVLKWNKVNHKITNLSNVGAFAAHVGPGDDHAPLPIFREIGIIGDKLRPSGFDERFDDGMPTFLDDETSPIGSQSRTTISTILRHVSQGNDHVDRSQGLWEREKEIRMNENGRMAKWLNGRYMDDHAVL